MNDDLKYVVKGLKCLAQQREEPFDNPCQDCKYNDSQSNRICALRVAEDTLVLLKQQEELLKKQEDKEKRIARWLAEYAAPPNARSSLAVYGSLAKAWEETLKDI